MPRSGDKIGPYTLRDKLGRGSFGEVWLADNPSDLLYQQVAVKLPHDEDVDIDAIRQEAKVWREVSGHPNVVPFIEAKIYDGQIVIVSEYANGGSLAGRLKQQGGKTQSHNEAVEMLRGILDGLQHLHSRHIVHRDLKPGNILLQGNVPRLADFGLSKAITSSQSSSANLKGTIPYMPPEAFQSKRSFQTDIWATGVIFYQMLTGRLPFERPDDAGQIMAILMHEPDQLPAEISPDVREFINRALQKQPENRFQSVFEMRAALDKFSLSSAEDDIETIVTPILVETPSVRTVTAPQIVVTPSLPAEFTNEIGMKFALISPGEFLMGTDIENFLTVKQVKLRLAKPTRNRK